MRRCPPISIGLLLLMLFCTGMPLGAASLSAGAHKPVARHTTKASIEALEEQWRQALLTGDVAAMDMLLAEDYVGIGANGQINTKAMQLERMKNRGVLMTQLDFSDVKIKLVGQVAIVTALSQISSTTDGKPVNGMFRSTRVYQQLANGQWKITSSEVTRVPTGAGASRHTPEPATPQP